MADATLKDLMAFFDMGVGEFGREWKKMSDQDKQQLKAGIGDGSLTY